MDKTQVIETLKKAREGSQKRNFTQSIDLIINLRDIDLKKTEQSVNIFHTMHYPKGKKVKICALVGPELLPQAKEVCDMAVSVDDFSKYQKKEAKKLATGYDFFIAQATIMPKVAQTFGKAFGPKGKMPNPKAGCVVPPNANLKPLYERLQKTVKLQTKNDPIIQAMVGNEKMKDEEVADNVMTTYDAVIHHLPSGKNNIKNVMIKLTMGKAFQVGKEKETQGEKEKEIKK
ncbi:50S ribosomal protein L1 [Candidatus Woesearchaeota archaeon]|nr:50S ribosomal protein L1 [Candidatus Woesearchaeota archaeon]